VLGQRIIFNKFLKKGDNRCDLSCCRSDGILDPIFREKNKKQKEIMEGIQQLPPHQQQQFMRELEMMQLKDSLWYEARIY
jgi:hypothetical protein